MTHRRATNYAKNYCNRTLIVKVIVENVVTCFGGHSVYMQLNLYRGYGTTYRQRSGGEALRSDIIDDYLRRFCSFGLRHIVTFYLA